eukprot:scaffold16212_cov112-Isochrysis_galbana.AAC.2
MGECNVIRKLFMRINTDLRHLKTPSFVYPLTPTARKHQKPSASSSSSPARQRAEGPVPSVVSRAWFSPSFKRCLRPCTPPVRLFSVYSLHVQPSIRQAHDARTKQLLAISIN